MIRILVALVEQQMWTQVARFGYSNAFASGKFENMEQQSTVLVFNSQDSEGSDSATEKEPYICRNVQNEGIGFFRILSAFLHLEILIQIKKERRQKKYSSCKSRLCDTNKQKHEIPFRQGQELNLFIMQFQTDQKIFVNSC